MIAIHTTEEVVEDTPIPVAQPLPPSPYEYEITEYVIEHSDKIKEDLMFSLGDTKVPSIYTEEFEEEVLGRVIQTVALGLNLSYLDVAEVMTINWMRRIGEL